MNQLPSATSGAGAGGIPGDPTHRGMIARTDRRRIRICVAVAVCGHLVLSYHLFSGWWHSAAGTAIIVGASAVAWKSEFPRRLGLRIPARTLAAAAGLAALVYMAALLLLEIMNLGRPTRFDPLAAGHYVHFFFYTLNEEIILGSLPLFYLCHRLRQGSLRTSLILALVFTAAHQVFFRWVFPERGNLEFTTLMTLFWIGLLRNNLILMTGHVGYSWAIHLGWMSAMFGSGASLTEPQRFNTYLGSTPVFILTMILAAASVAALKWGKRVRPPL